MITEEMTKDDVLRILFDGDFSIKATAECFSYFEQLPLSQFADLVEAINSYLLSDTSNTCFKSLNAKLLFRYAFTAAIIKYVNSRKAVFNGTEYDDVRNGRARSMNLRIYNVLYGLRRNIRNSLFDLNWREKYHNIITKVVDSYKSMNIYYIANIDCEDIVMVEEKNFHEYFNNVIYSNGAIYCSREFKAIGENNEGIFHVESEGDDYEECYHSGYYYHRDDMTYLEYYDHAVHTDSVDIVYCEYMDSHVYECDTVECMNRHGEYIRVHQDSEDLIYTDDETYFDEAAAEANDCWYDENEGSWFEAHQRRTDNYFENFYSNYAIRRHKQNASAADHKVYLHKLGVESITNRELNNMKYTFGVEIETDDAPIYLEPEAHMLNVKAVSDGSVNGPEFVTGTLYGDTGLEQIRKISNRLKACNATVNRKCGIHVHIGGAMFTRRFQVLAIMLGMQLQDEMFAMQPLSRRDNNYCKLIPDKYFQLKPFATTDRVTDKQKQDALKLLFNYVTGSARTFDKNRNKKTLHPNGHYCSSRYKWLNLNNCAFNDGPETVEFRLHSGTIEHSKIIPFIKICMAFVNFVENRSRRVSLGFMELCDYHERKTMSLKNPVTISEILRYSFPDDKAQELIEHVNTRTVKFM